MQNKCDKRPNNWEICEHVNACKLKANFSCLPNSWRTIGHVRVGYNVRSICRWISAKWDTLQPFLQTGRQCYGRYDGTEQQHDGVHETGRCGIFAWWTCWTAQGTCCPSATTGELQKDNNSRSSSSSYKLKARQVRCYLENQWVNVEQRCCCFRCRFAWPYRNRKITCAAEQMPNTAPMFRSLFQEANSNYSQLETDYR